MIRPVLEAAARIGRPPARTVAPPSPFEPEPYPGDPFAPVYDFVPLRRALGDLEWVTDPYGPDPLVFGADLLLQSPYPGCTRDGERRGGRFRSCRCGASQAADGACWACGRTS